LAVGSFRLIHGVGTPQLQFGEPRHVLEVSIGAEQTEVSAQAQPGDQRINRAHLDSPRAARCVLLGGLPVVGSTRNQQRQLFKLGNDPVLDSTFAQSLERLLTNISSSATVSGEAKCRNRCGTRTAE
jgi:hypothetical protein